MGAIKGGLARYASEARVAADMGSVQVNTRFGPVQTTRMRLHPGSASGIMLRGAGPSAQRTSRTPVRPAPR
jgi:hypothetical protein